MFELFTVTKIPNARAWVVNGPDPEVNGVAYKNPKFAEQLARGATMGIFNGAEYDNDRFDACRRYLAQRAQRIPVAPAQMELF